MHPLQRSLLRAKHWEIFSLWLAFGIFGNFVVHVVTVGTPKSQLAPTFDLVLGILAHLDTLVVWVWCYVVGTFLRSISPKHLRLRPSVFFLAIICLFSLNCLRLFWIIPEFNLAKVLIPSLAFICYVYTNRFAAKSLMVAEYQEAAQFPRYFVYLLAVFVFPIGIWFLQPIVNELFALDHVLPLAPDAIPSLPHPSA